MISDVLEIFAAPRSPRFTRGHLTTRAVKRVFAEIRKELTAQTLHAEYRKRQAGSGVTWSLWIGRFDKAVPWLSATRFKETRYAFVLLLEHRGYVGVLSNSAGDVAHLVATGRVSYQKLLALRSGSDAEVESLSTRSLRAARVGVTRSTLSGRHLERVVSRVGASQAAPSQVVVRQADQAWRISPGAGRVTLSGSRATIPVLCNWFAQTCQEIEGATEPSAFLKAFAHPISLDDLPPDVEPTSLQLDPTILDDLLEGGAILRRGGADLDDSAIEEMRQLVRDLWLVAGSRADADGSLKIWRLTSADAEVGQLTVRSTKISLSSDRLREVEVADENGMTKTLLHVFNGNEQPLRIGFSDVTYGYALGQLFRDHRLLGSRHALLELLSGSLPPGCSVEKAEDGRHFAAGSLFGVVVNDASADDQFLMCDDMGSEWADFIGVSAKEHRVTFYHCKGGTVDVGASGLHEVVSQATKNLGYLTASAQELEARRARWSERWREQPIARLQRGASVAVFMDAFAKAVVAPQATRRVVIVTSSLSKGALARAFDNLDQESAPAAVIHVLWLLSAFVDECRNVGAVPQVLCRP